MVSGPVAEFTGTAREMLDGLIRGLTRNEDDAKEATRLLYKAVGTYDSLTKMINHDPQPRLIELTKFWTDPEDM